MNKTSTLFFIFINNNKQQLYNFIHEKILYDKNNMVIYNIKWL